MPKKLGLMALAVVASLGVVSPAFADDDTTTTAGDTPTTESTAPPVADPTTTATTDAPTDAPIGGPITGPIGAPAIPGDQTDGSEPPRDTESGASELGPVLGTLSTPSRGTQVQLAPPPPPPPALPDWAILPEHSGSGRRVVYSKSQQAVWALDENNNIIKYHRVSGRQTPLDPRPGVYSVWSRSLHTNSIENPSITWKYMVRFAKGARGGNIGFHEIPFQYGRPVQSEAQLGQALSGGCVRQAVSDAVWMWNWAQLGTVVVVLP